MKRPLEMARRWLSQAEHSLDVTRLLVDGRAWSDACFHAEQTAQMALKAFLYLRGRRSIRVPSVRELALECSREDGQFSSLVAQAGVLDRYYLSSRYPDAVPAPAVPFEMFSQEEADQAWNFARTVVETVRVKISGGPAS